MHDHPHHSAHTFYIYTCTHPYVHEYTYTHTYKHLPAQVYTYTNDTYVSVHPIHPMTTTSPTPNLTTTHYPSLLDSSGESDFTTPLNAKETVAASAKRVSKRIGSHSVQSDIVRKRNEETAVTNKFTNEISSKTNWRAKENYCTYCKSMQPCVHCWQKYRCTNCWRKTMRAVLGQFHRQRFCFICLCILKKYLSKSQEWKRGSIT